MEIVFTVANLEPDTIRKSFAEYFRHTAKMQVQGLTLTSKKKDRDRQEQRAQAYLDAAQLLEDSAIRFEVKAP